MGKASSFALKTAANITDADWVIIVPSAGDPVRITVPEARQLLGALGTDTVSAYYQTGLTKEDKINAAITYAALNGKDRVFVPTSMYPYNASAVTFNAAVQMVREGGTFDVYDVQAYGAAGNGSTDDSPAVQAAISAASTVTGGATVYFPVGVFFLVTTLTGGTDGIAFRGAGRMVTTLKKSGANSGALLVTPAGIRGYTVEHLGLYCLNGAGNVMTITANFGHVQLRDLFIQQSSAAHCIDATAGNGIDVCMENVRATGGIVAFHFSAAGLSINGANFFNCYALSCDYGFVFGNCGLTLTDCAADSCVWNGFNLSGTGTLSGCSAEANTNGGFVVNGVAKLTLSSCFTSAQIQPFVVGAVGADVCLINPNTDATPSGSSLSVSAGNCTLIGGDGLDRGLSTGSLGNVIQLNRRIIHALAPLTDAATIATDAARGDYFTVTVAAARTMGAPTTATNYMIGQRITYTIIQNATGGWAITWNAVFKGLTWSDVGNTANKRSSISFYFDGTNWNQDGAQAPYAT